MGCRIFFCDPDSQDWQNDEYERRLGELKRIGEARHLPYRYQEWLSALAETALPAALAEDGDNSPAVASPSVPNVDPTRPTVVELPQVRSTDSHR